MIELRSIYETEGGEVSPYTIGFLYRLLSERDEITNISHVSMPGRAAHIEFILSHPYREWWLIMACGRARGAAYLSKQNEIGVFILRGNRGQGFGPATRDEIVKRYGTEPLYANINPKNARSITMFEGGGFRHIQNTYRRDPSD